MGILRAILSFVRAFFANRAGLSYHSSCLTGVVGTRSAAWQATAMVKHQAERNTPPHACAKSCVF
jgi:hypothetical protein